MSADSNRISCLLVRMAKSPSAAAVTSGFPVSLVELAEVTGTTFEEPARTDLQSIYFVRAEDAQGYVSPPSNIAGCPSKSGL